jgi:hypothetical protein
LAGGRIRRAGLTLAGTGVPGACWSNLDLPLSGPVGETSRPRLEGLPKTIGDIAWKAQIRLCARYRRLIAIGEKTPGVIVIAAIARERAALWAIGRHVESAT